MNETVKKAYEIAKKPVILKLIIFQRLKLEKL